MEEAKVDCGLRIADFGLRISDLECEKSPSRARKPGSFTNTYHRDLARQGRAGAPEGAQGSFYILGAGRRPEGRLRQKFLQKPRAIAAVLILLARILPGESQSAGAPAWEKIGDGVQYASYSIDTSRGNASAHLLSVDLKRATLKILAARKFSEALHVDEFASRNPHAIAVFNGSFFDKLPGQQILPKGIIVSEGHLLRPLLRARAWGVFFIDTRGAHITTPAAYRNSRSVKLALQGLPRLVNEGWPLRLKAQTARRTAIGIRSDGAVMILISRQGASLSLDDVARSLLALGCQSALNLDGGSSTQLWVKHPRSPAITEHGFNKIPVALGVFSNAAGAGSESRRQKTEGRKRKAVGRK